MTLRFLSPKDFGARLVELRERRGWKQADLARKLGKTQPEVSRWEHGKVAPTYDTAAMLAEGLGCDVKDFMEEDDALGDVDAGRDSDGERWHDPFMEVMLREARAAERRAEAALRWANWLDVEARNRAEAHEMVREERAAREERRAQRAPVVPSPPPTVEEEKRSA